MSTTPVAGKRTYDQAGLEYPTGGPASLQETAESVAAEVLTNIASSSPWQIRNPQASAYQVNAKELAILGKCYYFGEGAKKNE